MNFPLIAPSILAADFTRLAEELKLLDASEADWVHFDVMDGQFVPNISFGMPLLEAIRPLTAKPIDVHLMIEQPERYVKRFCELGADHITIHAEACRHIDSCLNLIRSCGAQAGLAVNPATPLQVYEHVLPQLDIALLMSVNPGFGGQQFISYTHEKVRALRDMIQLRQAATLIAVDGGIGTKEAPHLLQAGADVLVAGSSVFRSENPRQTIRSLKQLPKGKNKLA